MYTEGSQDNKPVEAGSGLIVDRDSQLYHLFRFLQKSYGNDMGKFLTALNSFLALGITSKYIKNKKLRFILNTLRYGIPAFLYGSELYVHFKNYLRELKDERSPTFQRHIAKICKILEVKESDYLKLHSYKTSVGSEIVLWLISKPDTKDFKILKFYNIENIQELDTVKIAEGYMFIGLLIEYKSNKYLFEITLNAFEGYPVIIECGFHTAANVDAEKIEQELREVFLYNFINSLDTRKNVLCFKNYGSINYAHRAKVEEIINQFKVYDFIKELEQVLNCGRKRAYAFVSRPGTGKSTILRKIEEVMSDHVFFRLYPDDFETAHKIKDRFNIIQKIPKSVVIVEDLDSCGMHEKNSKAGVFLDEIDDVNNSLNMIILVTINDTSRVHFSIINRPGRFDKVIEIQPPETHKEIHEVMVSKAEKLKKKYCPNSKFKIPDLDKLDAQCMSECLSRQFTQAEITNAITEQIFIYISIGVSEKSMSWDNISDEVFNKLFKDSIESHKKTLQAIKKCNFNNSNPTDFEETKVKPIALIKHPT